MYVCSQEMNIICDALVNDTTGALLAGALKDNKCAIGLILCKFPILVMTEQFKCPLSQQQMTRSVISLWILRENLAPKVF